jgi:putative hemolysin
MKLLTSNELAKATNLNVPGGAIIAKILMGVLSFNKLNKFYSSVYHQDALVLINSALDELDISYEIQPDQYQNIPETGPCIIVSNHPYGGIDALMLMKLLFARRPDFKVMANFLLQRIEPFRDYLLPVNPFETKKNVRSSLAGIKETITYLNEGHCILIFPAGEVSSFQTGSNQIMDKEWQLSAIKLIKKASVPIIPVYCQGTNSVWFHLLGKIHPILRTAKLPSEFLKTKNKSIRIVIGKPISVKDQLAFTDMEKFGRYLRARTYTLSSDIQVKPFFAKFRKKRLKKPVPVEEGISNTSLVNEIERLRISTELFSLKNYSVFFIPASDGGIIIRELGRLREITFRAAGEGTNRATDIDEYDLYFYHLVVWDNSAQKIVGAYRIGKGDEIISMFGLKGFYINSLFKISLSFTKYLEKSLELGRSFIVEDYQKKPLSLFLLWKGLITVLVRNSDYRYLIGPVSISNDFSMFSKALMVEFISRKYADPELNHYIRPRNKFVIKPFLKKLTGTLIENSDDGIHKIEKLITSIDNGKRIPVLFKRYIELNARILEFNTDPDFNNCLDGLMLLDVTKIPEEFVRTLLKDTPDESVLSRFASKNE